MLPVEIVPVDGTTLVLRARGSELLILPQHIGHLKSCKNPKDFTGYFLGNALLNRPARKLFEAWLRKDKSLWQRIYRTIQADMDLEKIKQFQERMDEDTKTTSAPEKTERKIEKAPAKVAAPKETKKPAAAEPKKAAKKAEAVVEKADVKKKPKASAPAKEAAPAKKTKAAAAPAKKAAKTKTASKAPSAKKKKG